MGIIDILKEFESLSKDSKISVLSDAIDLMQEWNGRSKGGCIAIAMGYVSYENDIGIIVYHKPFSK